MFYNYWDFVINGNWCFFVKEMYVILYGIYWGVELYGGESIGILSLWLGIMGWVCWLCIVLKGFFLVFWFFGVLMVWLRKLVNEDKFY